MDTALFPFTGISFNSSTPSFDPNYFSSLFFQQSDINQTLISQHLPYDKESLNENLKRLEGKTKGLTTPLKKVPRTETISECIKTNSTKSSIDRKTQEPIIW